MEQHEILICECHSVDHQIIFSYEDSDPNWSEVYMQIHLTKIPFWQRVKYGIQYIFGKQCRYGAFDEVVLKPKDHIKLQKIVDYLKKVEKKEKKLMS